MRIPDKENIYTKEQVENIILDVSKTTISDVAIHKRINKMIAFGKLSRVGNGRYAFVGKRKFDYAIAHDVSVDVLNKLEKRFGKNVRFVIYESTILNMFLNHLIVRPTVIVEVEKDVAETAFWFLKEEGFGNVLLNPSEDENYLYNPYDGTGVIVKPMVSKAPIDHKRHKITIEKLAVDIVCDRTLNMFYEGAEISPMVEDILRNYAIKFDSVRNYAKRRHGFDKFIQYVPKELKGAFHD